MQKSYIPCLSPFQTQCCEWGLTKLNIYNYTGFHTISTQVKIYQNRKKPLLCTTQVSNTKLMDVCPIHCFIAFGAPRKNGAFVLQFPTYVVHNAPKLWPWCMYLLRLRQPLTMRPVSQVSFVASNSTLNKKNIVHFSIASMTSRLTWQLGNIFVVFVFTKKSQRFEYKNLYDTSMCVIYFINCFRYKNKRVASK